MGRLSYNSVKGYLGAALAAGDTTVTFGSGVTPAVQKFDSLPPGYTTNAGVGNPTIQADVDPLTGTTNTMSPPKTGAYQNNYVEWVFTSPFASALTVRYDLQSEGAGFDMANITVDGASITGGEVGGIRNWQTATSPVLAAGPHTIRVTYRKDSTSDYGFDNIRIASVTAAGPAAALTGVPNIGGGDYLPLSLLDANGNVSEVVYVTGYVAGASTATIVRGQEGSTAVQHLLNDKWVHGATAYDAVGVRAISSLTGTAYTLAFGDASKAVLAMSNAAAITLTIPTNAAVSIPVGASVEVLQAGAGQVTVAGASGVTVTGYPSLKSAGQGARIRLTKTATDTWFVDGDLDSPRELAHAENVSGTVTSCSGQFTYAYVEGCGVTVPPQSTPWEMVWEAAIQVTTPGAGLAYAALMETTDPANPTLVSAAFENAGQAGSGTYSSFLANVKGRRRFGPTTTARTFTLALVNLQEAGSALATQSVNSDSDPSYISAVKL